MRSSEREGVCGREWIIDREGGIEGIFAFLMRIVPNITLPAPEKRRGEIAAHMRSISSNTVLHDPPLPLNDSSTSSPTRKAITVRNSAKNTGSVTPAASAGRRTPNRQLPEASRSRLTISLRLLIRPRPFRHTRFRARTRTEQFSHHGSRLRYRRQQGHRRRLHRRRAQQLRHADGFCYGCQEGRPSCRRWERGSAEDGQADAREDECARGRVPGGVERSEGLT